MTANVSGGTSASGGASPAPSASRVSSRKTELSLPLTTATRHALCALAVLCRPQRSHYDTEAYTAHGYG